jgi:transposase
MDALAEFEYLWDRQSGWQLDAVYVRRWAVIVMFGDDLSCAKK